jgi:hypothetical protein
MCFRTTLIAIAAIGFASDHSRAQLAFYQIVGRVEAIYIEERQHVLAMQDSKV